MELTDTKKQQIVINILHDLEKKTEIDYCGLYRPEIYQIMLDAIERS